MNKKVVKVLAVTTVFCANSVLADMLSSDLTSAGAEKAANKDGTIPAIGNASTPQSGWTFGKNRQDFWAYKGEKPLFSIDASNVDKYADKLSPAQIQMIKQTKGYRMDIYPTHRNCSEPEFVQANTKANLTRGKIGSDGWSLEDAALPGIPFQYQKRY